MPHRGFLCGAAVLMMCARAAIADAPPALSVQAAQGKAAYAVHCTACHGSELEGGLHAPALLGPAFRSHWDGKPARAVYSRIISTMPQDSPGSLSEREALTIALYVFAVNGIPTGEQPIASPAALNSVTIPTQAITP
jgi:mono/diheme cytochrome c family protein